MMRNKIIKILITVMLLGGMTAVAVAENGGGNVITVTPTGNDDKVTICHVPPGNPENPQTITIGISALPAHKGNHQLDQEIEPGFDSVGACSTSSIPEFPTIALPIAAMIGLVFLFQHKKKKVE